MYDGSELIISLVGGDGCTTDQRSGLIVGFGDSDGCATVQRDQCKTLKVKGDEIIKQERAYLDELDLCLAANPAPSPAPIAVARSIVAMTASAQTTLDWP